MMKWKKASFGGTTQKSGGGSLKSPMNEGNRGITGGTGLSKSKVSRGKSTIDAPGKKGNMGVNLSKPKGTGKAPRD